MSQEKVNLRKENKKNRKEIMAKEKRNRQMTKLATYLCLVVVIGVLGFSVYKKFTPASEHNHSEFTHLVQTDEYGILQPSLDE